MMGSRVRVTQAAPFSFEKLFINSQLRQDYLPLSIRLSTFIFLLDRRRLRDFQLEMARCYRRPYRFQQWPYELIIGAGLVCGGIEGWGVGMGLILVDQPVERGVDSKSGRKDQ